jgi:hypothetical protein
VTGRHLGDVGGRVKVVGVGDGTRRRWASAAPIVDLPEPDTPMTTIGGPIASPTRVSAGRYPAFRTETPRMMKTPVGPNRRQRTNDLLLLQLSDAVLADSDLDQHSRGVLIAGATGADLGQRRS